jgi:hypothetical protein
MRGGIPVASDRSRRIHHAEDNRIDPGPDGGIERRRVRSKLGRSPRHRARQSSHSRASRHERKRDQRHERSQHRYGHGDWHECGHHDRNDGSRRYHRFHGRRLRSCGLRRCGQLREWPEGHHGRRTRRWWASLTSRFPEALAPRYSCAASGRRRRRSLARNQLTSSRTQRPMAISTFFPAHPHGAH